MAAWVRREEGHMVEAGRKVDEAAELVAKGTEPVDLAEKMEARFHAQKDGLEGWVIGQLLVGVPAFDREPPANFGRAVIAWLRESGWSPGEAEAVYQVCLGAIAETRRQIVPRAVEVKKIVDFGGPPEAKPTS